MNIVFGFFSIVIHRDLFVCSLLWRQTARVIPIVIECLCAVPLNVSLSGTLFESFIREKKKEDTVYNIIF